MIVQKLQDQHRSNGWNGNMKISYRLRDLLKVYEPLQGERNVNRLEVNQIPIAQQLTQNTLPSSKSASQFGMTGSRENRRTIRIPSGKDSPNRKEQFKTPESFNVKYRNTNSIKSKNGSNKSNDEDLLNSLQSIRDDEEYQINEYLSTVKKEMRQRESNLNLFSSTETDFKTQQIIKHTIFTKVSQQDPYKPKTTKNKNSNNQISFSPSKNHILRKKSSGDSCYRLVSEMKLKQEKSFDNDNNSPYSESSNKDNHLQQEETVHQTTLTRDSPIKQRYRMKSQSTLADAVKAQKSIKNLLSATDHTSGSISIQNFKSGYLVDQSSCKYLNSQASIPQTSSYIPKNVMGRQASTFIATEVNNLERLMLESAATDNHATPTSSIMNADSPIVQILTKIDRHTDTDQLRLNEIKSLGESLDETISKEDEQDDADDESIDQLIKNYRPIHSRDNRKMIIGLGYNKRLVRHCNNESEQSSVQRQQTASKFKQAQTSYFKNRHMLRNMLDKPDEKYLHFEFQKRLATISSTPQNLDQKRFTLEVYDFCMKQKSAIPTLSQEAITTFTNQSIQSFGKSLGRVYK
ncbi:UNKNOWN [Stylonychia lemnae]|uniref:Uncharacterized protein n=1 Tax=Stylonychia lemnae TaxID=5949 RepID=A0A078ABJ4_STYLE|nr:UNKNOWN [Stylonychia lemnae]|eukprot:CDW79241.1 UNKNOWN [Stylonychia lemnae]